MRLAANAPLTYRSGTLAGAVDRAIPVQPSEIAKSGTDDNDGNTRGKFAVGARDGASWFAMVVPLRGDIGGGRLSILPLVRAVRTTAMQRLVVLVTKRLYWLAMSQVR